MDVRNFLYNSDYAMPALVWEYSGVIDGIGGYNIKSVTIPHKLPFRPLLIGVWSDNNNFNPAYDISNPFGSATLTGGHLSLNQCGSDDTNVVVEGYNSGGDTKNLYFKLLAFVPPDYSGEVPNIYDTTNFMFSTDYNYPKIVKEGVVNIGSYQSTTIAHGLGYIPQAKVWGPDAYGRTTPLYRVNGDYGVGGITGPSIDENNLTIGAEYAGDYYYHIYGDSCDVGA